MNKDFSDLSQQEIAALKIRILDSLGCAYGALGADVIRRIHEQVVEFGFGGHCKLIGGDRSSPDRAALYNSALVRYLDFNDSFLAKHETCHPSDTISGVLAAAEYAKCSGKELLSALAISYQVQCRLSECAPVRRKGFDHTTQGAYGVAAGCAKALSLDSDRTAHAISIAAVGNVALRVTRTGALSHWKGLAFPNTAFLATHNVFLAMRGITGPLEIFEGNKGFKESISGPFSIDWSSEGTDAVLRTIIKKYNAEIHSQSALEAIIHFCKERKVTGDMIERIDVAIFDVAFHIIGGGEEGDKTQIQTKEQADHSLQYMMAVAILDGTVGPEQYLPERICKSDVQNLLRRIQIKASPAYSARFPNEMPVSITIHLKDGSKASVEHTDYEGFFTRPLTWEQALEKFDKLAPGRRNVADAIANLEVLSVADITDLL